ncbi:RNA recognition motif domain-containing protein [Limnoglobus roseus]|uniref:RNA recognition motif domain-containing protein n=1 Tax=Limnoglobus roseus TaxID=2598579 RepID=UPI001FE8E40B|nr:RNA-binding protein [Limnoglobus roseus]
MSGYHFLGRKIALRPVYPGNNFNNSQRFLAINSLGSEPKAEESENPSGETCPNDDTMFLPAGNRLPAQTRLSPVYFLLFVERRMSKNLYVGNMSFSTTEDQLREAFSQYGSVTKVQLIMDRETGRPRGFAFVDMADGGDAAIQALNGAQLDGRTLTVNEAKPREDRGGGGGGGRGGYGGGRSGGGGGYGGGRSGGGGGRY